VRPSRRLFQATNENDLYQFESCITFGVFMTTPRFEKHSDDLTLQRILCAPTWRARFFEAAANAAASIVKYSIERQDAIGASLWMERQRFFRRKAIHSGATAAMDWV
jgi:hypothetical protein